MIDSPVKLGLYGCGNRTRALLDAVRLDNVCQVVAAYDLASAAVDAVTQEYGGTACGFWGHHPKQRCAVRGLRGEGKRILLASSSQLRKASPDPFVMI